MSAEKLAALRAAIDKTDLKLIELLEERLKLVKEAAAVKSSLGEGSRSLEREDFLLADRARLAAEHGLPEGLFPDLLKRILRESYKEGADRSFSCTNPECGDIVIIGGSGGMGRIFRRFFEASGYVVRTLGSKDWDQAPQMLRNAAVVMVSVPIDKTEAIIRRAAPLMSREAILCDVTSVKAPILKCMLEAHPGPVLGLHPMFGPDIKGMVKQVIVNTGGRETEKSQFLIEEFKIWGARVVDCSAQEHDRAMGIIQAMRHFTTYCYGLFLARLNPDLGKILELSSPIYHLELLMVGRLFAQDPHLYCDIIMASERNTELIREYFMCIKEQLETVASQDKESFTARFLEARAYFGEHAQQFLKESGQLLARVNDDKR